MTRLYAQLIVTHRPIPRTAGSLLPRSTRGWLLLSGALFVLVIALHLYLIWVGPFPGDRFAAAHFSAPWTEPAVAQQLSGFYNYLGTAVPATALVVAAAVLLWRHQRRQAVAGLLVACVSVVVNELLKVIFGPSPLWVATHHGGRNFPSGHTTFVTAVIGYLGVLAWRRGQRDVAVIALLLVIGVGPARVIGGEHLVSDVIAGYLLGGAWLILAVLTVDRDWWTSPVLRHTRRRRIGTQGASTHQKV